jgi:flagellar L-ring protein precursor FlgH
MSRKLFSIALILTCLAAVGLAQDKDAKKEKKKSEPKLSVVEISETRPVPPPVEVVKPTNGSLYTDISANGNLLRDFKAREVGDLVFVDVVETSSATVSSNAKRDRDSGNLGGLVPLINALPVSGAPVAGTVAGELGKRKFEGKGSTARNSSVRARITARVVEVFANGDMRIEAVKVVKINKETEKLAVTGIVRPNDLARDNSIETFFIGDLRVELNGKGIASADNAPGWLFRLFDKISPF